MGFCEEMCVKRSHPASRHTTHSEGAEIFLWADSCSSLIFLSRAWPSLPRDKAPVWICALEPHCVSATRSYRWRKGVSGGGNGSQSCWEPVELELSDNRRLFQSNGTVREFFITV